MNTQRVDMPPAQTATRHVVHVIAGLQTGGAEHMLLKLAGAELPGLRQTVVSMTDEGPMGPQFRAAGIRLLTIGMPRGRLPVSGLLRLHRVLREERPDVVQTWMYHADLVGGLLARLAGVRRVIWNIRHSTLSPRDNKRTVRAVAWACARVSRWVPEQIISCSRAGALTHQAAGYADDRFVIIPNGVDGARFRPDPTARAELRATLGLAGDTPLLGCIARWDPQKNHAGLLEAWAGVVRDVPDAVLLLAGQGVDQSNAVLHALLQRSGVEGSVRVLGLRSDMPQLMAALDGLVLPSVHGEGFPNVLVEALACGVPCVATDVGDAALILGAHGTVVPPADASALREALLALLGRGVRQGEQGAADRRRSDMLARFSLSQVLARYANVYHSGVLPGALAEATAVDRTGPR